MGPFNGPTIAILVILALLLFGAKKLPDLARSLGRSARILKAESKGLIDEENESAETSAPPQQPQAQAQQAQAQTPQHQQPQAQSYPQLPPGQRIVNESGETTDRTYDNR
ncbi:Sec-independent protein translocase subunit TatA [Nocardiopsis sp. N85]|uniref:Sec-independent protein translocase subunit TatA n=1 Tax=Nocardiopsis sp. N85 TaxID=3029400 RepID=UPI00237F8925|nr:Sec-independent protein translocase subunit TatA [Nocardiopsis sp. N85]MDE3723613.1 Sec-independent protein translocase subunit TatA [Nocardiopsis sp. N85]